MISKNMPTGFNSLKRRSELNKELEELEESLPFSTLSTNKLSKLRVLKATCAYLKKEKHFTSLKNENSIYDKFNFEQQYGFIVAFSTKGELIYISENVVDHLGFYSLDILLTHDSIFELICDQDKNTYKFLLENFNSNDSNKITFFSNWFVSKIKRKNIPKSEFKLLKMIGCYDKSTELFIFNCQPVLSKSNRDYIMLNDPNCFKTLHKLNLEFFDLCSNAVNLIDFKEEDIEEKCISLYDILSHECLKTVAERHTELLNSKMTKNFVEHVKIMTKNGSILDCLMNMHINNKGYIVAYFQLMNDCEIKLYNDYSLNVNQTNLTKTHDDMDELDDEDLDFEDDLDSRKTKKTDKKRKLKENFVDDSEVANSKKIKKPSQLTVKRVSSAQVKIEGIKQLLINEIQSLENGWPFEEYIELIKEQPNESFNENVEFKSETVFKTENNQFDQSSNMYYTGENLNEDEHQQSLESPLTTAETIINESNLDYEEKYFDENILNQLSNLIAENNNQFYSFQNNNNDNYQQDDLKYAKINHEHVDHVIKTNNYECDFGNIPSEDYNYNIGLIDQQEDRLFYFDNYNYSF